MLDVPGPTITFGGYHQIKGEIPQKMMENFAANLALAHPQIFPHLKESFRKAWILMDPEKGPVKIFSGIPDVNIGARIEGICRFIAECNMIDGTYH